MMKLEGKVALVTGGGTGAGKAIGKALAAEGCSVAVNYAHSSAEAEQAAEEIRRTGVRSIAVRADVSDDEEARQAVRRTVEELGRLDILVNCAGYTEFIDHQDLEGLTEEIWHRTLNVNLGGVFYCSRAAIPEMRKNGRGSIINIASTAAVTGLGSSIAYSASKAAILSVTRSMAMAFAPEIQVNAVSPGTIGDTRWMIGHDDWLEGGKRLTPMGRLVTAADIAEVVLWFATSSGFVTGQNIIADGGRTVHY